MKCRVEGCERSIVDRSSQLCRPHYARFKRHGDPLAGATGKGYAREFLNKASVVESDECLIYPFYRDKNGYGKIRVNGKSVGAHVYVCEKRHGPKPSDNHESCHSCGNGHVGCVNGSHLRWGTRKANIKDAINHGTSYLLRVPFGEENHCAKFSNDLIADFKKAVALGQSVRSAAIERGISPTHGYGIVNGFNRKRG